MEKAGEVRCWVMQLFQIVDKLRRTAEGKYILRRGIGVRINLNEDHFLEYQQVGEAYQKFLQQRGVKEV